MFLVPEALMVVVVAQYRTRLEHVDRVRAVLARHAVASESEPGCLTFSAHQDVEDPTRFVLYEAYESEAAFQVHRDSEHFATNITGTVAPLLVERTWRRYGERF